MSVDDPNVIDFIAHDPTGVVVLVMVEARPWDGTNQRLFELQEKINSYAAYVLDGKLIADYPEFAEKSVRLELRFVEDVDRLTTDFLERAKAKLRDIGLSFAFKKLGANPAG